MSRLPNGSIFSKRLEQFVVDIRTYILGLFICFFPRKRHNVVLESAVEYSKNIVD